MTNQALMPREAVHGLIMDRGEGGGGETKVEILDSPIPHSVLGTSVVTGTASIKSPQGII